MVNQMNVIERIQTLLAEPYLVGQQDIASLKAMREQYPYFEPLHALLAKADAEDKSSLALAAMHVNGAVLHRILKQEGESVKVAITEAEDAVFEEINEVDIHEFQQKPVAQENPSAKVETIENDFVLASISSSDFFAFEERFPTEDNSIAEVAAATEPETEPSSVSNYNDDSLPYTFLWWLAKTRKEHQSTFQPYATVKKSNPGALQQQYVEHIFHIQSPFNAEEVINNSPESKHIDPKETAIIDNFLKKDPQISPPKPEQIDNENKAKKSAEDHNDLVSETLAKIYIEQMLYHKAIDTYQKLSLKFPEKSRYFADLIQSLEKKI